MSARGLITYKSTKTFTMPKQLLLVTHRVKGKEDVISVPYPMKILSWEKIWRRINLKENAVINADDLAKEVNTVIKELQKKIVKLETDKNELATSLDKCRHHCWDYRKENQILKASGRSLLIED